MALPAEVQQLADLGFAVVPATAQKRPLVRWAQWTTRPQTREEQADLPRGDLYAIVTGNLYDLVVLDFDGEEGVNLATAMKLFPNVVTGSGGWHVWFHRQPVPIKTCAAVRPGLDVRGEGGLVYVYGTSSKGTYRIQSTERYGPQKVALLPAAVFPEKKAPTGGAPVGDWQGEGHGTAAALRVLQAGVAQLACAAEGERNATMTRVAYSIGGLVGAGVLDVEAAFAALMGAAEQCGAEDAVRVLGYQLEAGMAAPWSTEPEPDARGYVWVPATDLATEARKPDIPTSATGFAPRPQPAPVWTQERQPVPYTAFPAAVSELVSKGWEVSACPPEFLAAACLPVLGASLGGLVTLGLRQGWRIPPSCYMALVGEPGTAKSPALRRALVPVKFAEAAVWQNANPSARFMVDDVTPEKLVTLLQENERGLLVVTDELKGFFGGMGQYKGEGVSGRDRQFYLSCWSGEQVIVDRIKRGSTYLANPTLSVIGGIQPAVFDTLTNGEPDGMMERFLMVYGDPVADTWRDDDIDPGLTDAYVGLWNRLRDFGVQERHVDLTPEGMRAWKLWYDAFHRTTPPDKLASLWNKVRTHVARLALLYAACDGDSTQTYCDASHIERAVATVEWLLSHTLHVLRIASSSTPDERRHVKARDRLALFIEDYRAEHGDLPSGAHVLRYGPPGARRARERDTLLAELGLVLP